MRVRSEAVRRTMHRHQTYKFLFQLLRQKIVSACNIAAICCSSHVQENTLISNRFISIQSKTTPRLSEFKVSLQNFRVSFLTPKNGLKKHWFRVTHGKTVYYPWG